MGAHSALTSNQKYEQIRKDANKNKLEPKPLRRQARNKMVHKIYIYR